MEGLWGVLGYRRKNGCGHIAHKALVHLHFLPHHGLPGYCIHGTCFLDELKAIYIAAEKKSAEMAVNYKPAVHIPKI